MTLDKLGTVYRLQFNMLKLPAVPMEWRNGPPSERD